MCCYLVSAVLWWVAWPCLCLWLGAQQRWVSGSKWCVTGVANEGHSIKLLSNLKLVLRIIRSMLCVSRRATPSTVAMCRCGWMTKGTLLRPVCVQSVVFSVIQISFLRQSFGPKTVINSFLHCPLLLPLGLSFLFFFNFNKCFPCQLTPFCSCSCCHYINTLYAFWQFKLSVKTWGAPAVPSRSAYV